MTRLEFWRPWRTLVVLAVAIVASLAGVLLVPAGPAQALDWAPTVTVTGGTIRGSSDLFSGRRQFLGVPYAAPPIGANRFATPKPVVPWPGTRAATDQGNACPQVSNAVQPVGNISEDCLVLNVYAPPAAASKNLPVMVYIPGGGFQTGSIAQHDPAPLVATGKVIVVEMNYRLGAMGFLALPDLAKEGGGTGNYGLLDQQAALRWVRSNAAAFGGDPAAVTLFGESAGGQAVCDQLASPSARGLFRSAIVESGACSRTPLVPRPLASATARSQSFATSAGCPAGVTQLACLRALPVGAVLEDQSSAVSPTNLFPFLPAIDGVTLTTTPEQALRQGAARNIPVLQGSNHDESRLFVATSYDLNLKPLDAKTYPAYLQENFGAQAPRVLAEYPVSGYRTAGLAASAASTDADFACASAVTTAATAQGGGPTWQYEFDGTVPVLGSLDPFFPDGLGAFHTAELFYLFSTAASLPSTIGLDAGATALSKQLVTQWTTFARTGNPNGPGIPTWTPYTSASPQALRLAPGTSSMISAFNAGHHCAFWATIPR